MVVKEWEFFCVGLYCVKSVSLVWKGCSNGENVFFDVNVSVVVCVVLFL